MRSKQVVVATVSALMVLAALGAGACSYLRKRPDRRDVKKGRVETRTVQVAPNETTGAPYPPAKPSDRVPNVEHEIVPVPTGPRVGDMKPSNPPLGLKEERSPAKEPASRDKRR